MADEYLHQTLLVYVPKMQPDITFFVTGYQVCCCHQTATSTIGNHRGSFIETAPKMYVKLIAQCTLYTGVPCTVQ